MNEFPKLLTILGCPTLPLSSRLQLLRVKIGRRLPPFLRSDEISVFSGEVIVSPQKAEDIGAFDAIFLRQLYRTDYRGAHVLDIGAHKGYFSAYALSQGAAKVVAFEPEESNFNALDQFASSRRSNRSRLSLQRAGVAADDCELNLYVSTQSDAHSTMPPDDQEECVKQRVSCRSFSKVIAEMKQGREDNGRLIVKMNAEGAEDDIILSTPLDSLLLIDEFFLALHHQEQSKKILDHLLNAGLEVQKTDSQGHVHLTRTRR